MALYILISFAGYLSFGNKVPEFIASRPSLPNDSDILMSIAQVGMFIGMTVTVHLSVVSNRDTILSILNFKRKSAIDANNQFKPQMLLANSDSTDQPSFKQFALIGFLSAYIPFAISAFIRKNASLVIGLATSLYTPYIIIIVPG